MPGRAVPPRDRRTQAERPLPLLRKGALGVPGDQYQLLAWWNAQAAHELPYRFPM
jgi:hypothetical protein